MAEEEAVLFFPPQLAGELVKLAKQIVEQEKYERNLVREKKFRFRDVYPLNPELHKKFEEERKNKAH